MGIFDRFRKPSSQSRGAPGTVDHLSGGSDVIFNWAYSSTNPTSEACIRKIVSTLSSLKLDLYTHRKGGGRALMYGHPLALALKHPDPTITPMQFYAGMTDDILRGGAYIQVSRYGSAILLSRLNRDHVTVTNDNGRRAYVYGGKTLTDKEILYIPYPFHSTAVSTSWDITQGQSPADKYSDLIALDNSMNAYIKMYFGNSVGKSTVLEIDKDSKLGSKSMDEMYAALLPLMQKYVQGAKNSGKIIIPPTGTKLSTLDATQNLYADIKSLKEMVERQIAQGWGVPYSLISETNKYNSLEANQLQFLADTIEPLGTHIEQSFNRLLDPTETALYCKYDYKAILKSDIKTTVEYLAKEVGAGLLTINEARDALDLSAVDAGDFTFVPANLWPLTVENVGAFFAQSKLAAEKGAGDDKQ